MKKWLWTSWNLLYSVHEIFPYARQDESLRWLKKTFLGQEDYEFRVVVYRFSNP